MAVGKKTSSRVLSLNVRQWVEDLCRRRAQSVAAAVSASSPPRGKQDGKSSEAGGNFSPDECRVHQGLELKRPSLVLFGFVFNTSFQTSLSRRKKVSLTTDRWRVALLTSSAIAARHLTRAAPRSHGGSTFIRPGTHAPTPAQPQHIPASIPHLSTERISLGRTGRKRVPVKLAGRHFLSAAGPADDTESPLQHSGGQMYLI